MAAAGPPAGGAVLSITNRGTSASGCGVGEAG